MSDRELAGVLDLLSDAVWTLEAESLRPLAVNAAAQSIYGFSPQEFLSEPELRVRALHPEDRTRIVDAWTRAAGPIPESLEYRIVRADGVTRQVRESIRPAPTPERLTSVVTDITDRRHAQEAARVARDQAAEQVLMHVIELSQKNDALLQQLFERQRAEKVRAVLAVLGERLNAASAPRDAAQVILQAAGELFGWDAAFVDVYAPGDDCFYGVIRYDSGDEGRQEIAALPGGTPFTPLRTRLFSEGPLLILRDKEDQDETDLLVSFGGSGKKSASLMFAPIYRESRKTGIISVQSYTPGLYDGRDLELLQLLANFCCTGLERAFAEERLHQTERRLRLLIDQAAALSWTTNVDLRITSAGDAESEGGGERLVGKSAAELSVAAPDRMVTAHLDALKGQESSWEEMRSGEKWAVRVEPLRTARDGIVGCVGVASRRN